MSTRASTSTSSQGKRKFGRNAPNSLKLGTQTRTKLVCAGGKASTVRVHWGNPPETDKS